MGLARHFGTLTAALLLCWQSTAGAQTVQRVVVFRDGSVAPVELSEATLVWRHWPKGQSTEERIPLNDVRLLQFSHQRPTDVLARFETLVRELGHERFGIRQQAERGLLEMPSSVVPLLRNELRSSKDAEVRFRIRQLLHKMASGPTSDADVPADRIERSTAEHTRGDLGDCVLQATLWGQSLELSRDQVYQIRPDLPEVDQQAPAVERIDGDTDENFPTRTHTRLTFESDPSGRQIEPGTNVEKMFIPVGCTLRTSIDGAFVSVNNYDVGGRSGGFSCATHQPRFQGDLTIRFCLPNFPAIPAGVHQVGFWIAAVSPNGTALEAYDQHDRQLGSVLTTSRNRDFLAVRSSVPIAYVKIVPNPQIDPDYTIDDLVYTRPQPFSDGAADRYTVWLASGGHLHCQWVRLAEKEVVLENLSLGLPKVNIPRAQVTRLSTPTGNWAGPVQPPGCWVRLDDGSILRAVETNGRLHDPRGEESLLDSRTIVALWGDTAQYREAAGERFPMLHDGTTAKYFNASKFEASQLQLTGTTDETISFRSAPMVWLSRPAPLAAKQPRLDLVSGERLVLGPRYRLVAWRLQHVVVQRGDHSLAIPLSEIRSLVLP